MDGINSTIGESVWIKKELTEKESECDRNEILYAGRGNIVIEISEDQLQVKRYVVVEQDDRVFALSVINRQEICNEMAWKTEHPRLSVIESENKNRLILSNGFQTTEDVNLAAYVNSKLLYVEQSYKRVFKQLYADTVYRRCLLRREVLKNRLAMAQFSPHGVSTLINQWSTKVDRLSRIVFIKKY